MSTWSPNSRLPALAALAVMLMALAIPIVVGGVGASVVGSPGRYLGFLCLYDLMFALVCWASFEYVVTE